jgi:hypothetical protein
MVGYVNNNATGWTELRVHGVSGTPPESMLQHPHVARVAGYADAAFYRRWWESEAVSADTADHRIEAYSWGGLTSGNNKRALWLLLLPFMLLNVAFFMAPWRRNPNPEPGRGEPGKVEDRFSAAVQRLFALSFTGTFALAVVSVAMDLVAWQCGSGPATGGGVSCANGAGWLGWLRWGWLDSPGRQVAVAAVVPLAAIGLLWYLARVTWASLEKAPIDRGQRNPDVRTPLEDRALWNGRAAVRRLRALHVAAGLVIPGIFVAASLLPDPSRGLGALLDSTAWQLPLPAVRTVLLLSSMVLLAGIVVAVARPSTGSRKRPLAEPLPQEQEQHERRDRYRLLPWAALALTVASGLVAWWPSVDQNRVTAGAELPWLVGSVQALFLVQAALVLLLTAACWLLLRRRAASPPPVARTVGPDPAKGKAVPTGPVWGGFAMIGVVVLGWLVAGGFSAGLILRVAETLGSPVAAGQADTAATPLVVPIAYFWVAVAGLALALAAAALALITWLRLRTPPKGFVDGVRRAYPASDVDVDKLRLAGITRVWARSQGLTAQAQQAFGWFLLAAVSIVVATVLGYLVVGDRLITGASFLVTVANFALSGFVLILLWVGRKAYDNAGFRRTVGIAWDLGTFWPRAVHPLAPPCYAERTVPDLMGRLKLYAAYPGALDRAAVLSCHSQGTVLGAVVLLQLDPDVSNRTSFLIYGSPLSRLYARFFPAYFNDYALSRLGRLLDDAKAVSDGDVAIPRRSWRWRNLYRLSDPIGGPVFTAYEATFQPDPAEQAAGDNHDVDRQLIDPAFDRPAGDPCYPQPCGHSNYFADPAFDWTTEALRDGILTTSAVTSGDGQQPSTSNERPPALSKAGALPPDASVTDAAQDRPGQPTESPVVTLPDQHPPTTPPDPDRPDGHPRHFGHRGQTDP